MNCLFVRFPYESAYGGEELHSVQLAEFLHKKGHTVSFFGSCTVLYSLFKKNAYSAFYCPSVKMPVTFATLFIFLLSLPFLVPFLWVYILIIHAKYSYNTWYLTSLIDKLLLTPLALLLHVKVVWVEHQLIGRWLLKSPLRYVYTFLSRFVKIIPISYFNEQVLRTKLHVPNKSIVFILHGVDTQKFLHSTIHYTPFTIGYAGRIEKVKGLDYLVQTALVLKKDFPALQLLLCGTGSFEQALLQMIHTANAEEFIHMLPKKSDQEYIDFLHSLHVFVLPSISHHETFSLTTAEAMAASTLVVVTNTSGIAYFLPAEAMATIVSPASIDSLVTGIRQAFSLPPEARKITAQYCQKAFNQNHSLALFEEVLSHLN